MDLLLFKEKKKIALLKYILHIGILCKIFV